LARATTPPIRFVSESAITIQQQYAIKRLHHETIGNDVIRLVAEKDILLEAGILAHLPRHANIIQLHALSDGFWKDPAAGFMILDHLTETLHDRLQRWRRAPRPYDEREIPLYKVAARNKKRRTEQCSRMQYAALGVARAMEFLHKHKVIYRDLKPQTIGFDSRGVVRLFDFGLARVHIEGARQLTGFTGSARYMAPEVACSEPYSFPADVHAFSILLWEICSLERAYCQATDLKQLMRYVAQRKVRPTLNKIASPIIKELLPVSWHHDSAMRPSFALVVKQIELEGQAVEEQQYSSR